MIYSDRELSKKLERTEARANAGFVETRASLNPGTGACWIEVGGAFAMFDGIESPLTQTFGLGMFEQTTPEHLDKIEAFFRERGAPVFHEISPMADPSILVLLGERGYRPVELTSVMYSELSLNAVDRRPRDQKLTTRIIGSNEVDLWAKTSGDAWSTEQESLADFMFNFGRVSARCNGAFPHLAELDGRAVATGMLFIYDDVCLLAGASTIPDARNRGAQTALLEDRLEYAASNGCTLAIMGAAPGSQSQRNAQKNGFTIAYTRIKWQLAE
jgi:GNAT superfamily N-acetyltransferase